MDFLPVLISFVVIAIASKQIGTLFSKLHLPYITGYIFAGALAGPFILELLPDNTAEDLRFLDEIALAIIAFTAGNELYLRELRNRIRSIGIISIVLTLVVVTLGCLAVLFLADFIAFMESMPDTDRLAVALLGGTVLAALAPAVAIPVIQEVRAKGPFTKTVLGVTIFMDVVIIVTFAMMVAIADVLLRGASFDAFFIIVLMIDLVLSILLGLLSGKLLETLLAQKIPAWGKIGGILVVGFAIYELAAQVRDYTYSGDFPIEIVLEPLLISVIAGLYVTNYTAHRVQFGDLLHQIGPYVYVAFFTLTGVALKLDTLAQTLPIAVALFSVRLLGLFGGSFLGGTLAGDDRRSNTLLWMGFVSQAGIALGLAREVAVEFPELGNDFATLIISVIVLNEVFGPIFLRSALRRMGETHEPDQTQPDGVRNALIIGVGGQSIALAQQLRVHDWKVVIADTEVQQIQRLQDDNGIIKRQIDAITLESIRSLAPEEHTEAFIAMMGDDTANWQACEAAYEMGCGRIIVRLNDISWAPRFRELGAYVVDPTTAMVNLLDQFARAPQSAMLLLERDPEYQVRQVTVTDPDVHQVLLRDLNLTEDVLVLGIWRKNHSIVPHGYTPLHLHDEVTLLGHPKNLDNIARRLGY